MSIELVETSLGEMMAFWQLKILKGKELINGYNL
jgi:hypothetical protein